MKSNSLISLFSKNKYRIFIILFLLTISLLNHFASIRNDNFFWDDEYFIFSSFQFLKAPSWTSFWTPGNNFFKTWAMGYTHFWFLINFLKINSLIYFKLLNILFHVVNSLLIYNLATKMKFKYPIICTLFFLIHPLQVEVVSWIFQLFTILSLTYFLLSFFCLITFLEKEKKSYLVLAIFLFFLSLGTKSVAVFAPFIYLVVFYTYKVNAKKYIVLIPFFILSLTYGIASKIGTLDVSGAGIKKSHDLSIFKGLTQNEIEYLNFNLPSNNKVINFDSFEILKHSMVYYVQMQIAPFNLSFIYPKQKLNIFLTLSVFFITLAGVFILYIFIRNKKNYLIACSIFVFTMLPFIGITFVTFFYWSYTANRYTYFSLFGLSLIMGLIYEMNIKRKKIIFTVYLSYLYLYSIIYSFQFNDYLNLYQKTVKTNYHPVIISLLIEQYIYKLDAKNARKVLDEAKIHYPENITILNDEKKVQALENFYRKNNLKQIINE